MTITGSDPEIDPAQHPIPLPASRGERRRRRRQRRRARLTRTLGVILVLAAFVTFVIVINNRVTGDSDDKDAGSGAPAAAAIATRSVLLAQQGADGRALSLTVLVPSKEKGGTVLFVPPGTMTEVPSRGLEPVARALDAGGPDRLLSTVRNLLGAQVGTVVAVSDADLTEATQPAGPLSIDIPDRVEQTLPNKRIEVLYEPGRTTLLPGDVPQFLATRGNGNDLARLARQQAFWQAWLERISKSPSALPVRPAALRAAVSAIAAGEWDIRVIPVEAQGLTDDGIELYKAPPEELSSMVAAVFGTPVRGQEPRPRVRILNGTGELELAQKVTDKLLPADIQVTLTGNADRFNYERTQIVYYDPAKRSMAEAVKKALGVGELVHNRNETNVVDVTVIVGKDFRSS